MPSKLRKAIGAVKDQTSLSLAKVTNAANLEVVILKATTHDEIPTEERYINEIVSLVSSNKVYAAECAQSIGKRIGKTRNWVVALKSLMIILRIFQDGDPYFPREVLHAMKGGSRILNLSGFRDDSSSSPWEYTAFVRLMALYLDERLDCFLTGKLQRRITFNNHHHNQIPFKNHKMFNDNVGIKDMKPSMLLDKITYWQLLLDRALGTRPTGEAKKNHLVQISLYAVVQETFDLYRDISDGLAVILDSFFKLPYKACLSAFQACVKSCKQFDELSDFYSFCLSIRVGKSSEYPKVQKVSEELMETLQEFLKDQATTTSSNIEVISNYNHGQSFSYSSHCSPFSKHFSVSSLRESSSILRYSSKHDEGYERSYGTSSESCFETASEHASSHCTSLEDLMIATDAAGILTPTPRRFDIDYGGGGGGQEEKQEENNDDDYDASSSYESCSNNSNPINQAPGSSLDLIHLDEVQNEGNKEKHGNNVNNNNNINNVSQDCWELVLAETTTTTTEKGQANKNAIDSLFGQSDSVAHLQYNPFVTLDDTTIAPLTNVIDQTQTSLLGMINGNQNSSEPNVMAPTFTAQSFSFDSDLTSILVDSNSKTSSAMPASSFSLQHLAENSMALVPYFQENNNGLDSSTSVSQSQGSLKINPTSSSQNHDSYQMSRASTFTSQGSFKANSASDSQGYDPYQTSTEPTFNSQGSFKITSISSLQGHDPYLMSTRPKTFDSEDLFKYDSTLTSQGHNSYQTNTAPTITSQSSFKLSSSPYQGHDSYQTSIAPTFKTQNSFKNISTSSFHDHDSHQTSLRPTFNSQNSLQFSSASTSQGHDSYKTSTTPTFNSQSSLKNGSTSSFQDHDSYWTSTKPTLNSQNSFKTNSTPSSQTHESYHSDTAPTFYGHNSYKTSLESTFEGHNSSYMMGTTPTFHRIHSYQTNIKQSFQRHTSYQASIEPAFRTHNPKQVSTEPNSQGNTSLQSSTRPIFLGYSSSQMNTELTSHAYNSYLTNTVSPFYGNDSCQMTNGPTFQTHNSYQTNPYMIPSPSFRVQNSDSSMAEARSTIIARNTNNEDMVASTFWEKNLPNSMAEPTFHAKVSNGALLESPKEDDDPFESWPSSLTSNEDSLKKSMQQLSLEQQKQIWLEQQKRIIEKHI